MIRTPSSSTGITHRIAITAPGDIDGEVTRPVSSTQSTTLEWFMRDYVDHLKHHLQQALPDQR